MILIIMLADYRFVIVLKHESTQRTAVGIIRILWWCSTYVETESSRKRIVFHVKIKFLITATPWARDSRCFGKYMRYQSWPLAKKLLKKGERSSESPIRKNLLCTLVPRANVCRYCRYLQCISTVIYSGLMGHSDRMTQQLSKSRWISVSSGCWEHITLRWQAQVKRIITTLPVSKVSHCVRIVCWCWSSRVKNQFFVHPVSYSLSHS